MYVGGKLVQKAYLGSKKVYPEDGVIPNAIKDSMVNEYNSESLNNLLASNEWTMQDETAKTTSKEKEFVL